jgi:hypothetical protein
VIQGICRFQHLNYDAELHECPSPALLRHGPLPACLLVCVQVLVHKGSKLISSSKDGCVKVSRRQPWAEPE